jgi:hypothetical protein|tara:strand:+ start:60 stop:338 length:279 start_codon:yes stop_codon:yes gene_type:complete
MKKLSILIFIILCSISLVFANGENEHDESMEQMDSQTSEHSMHEGAGISHQLQMILPFSHFAEKHWFAGIMLVFMWISLVYGVFSILKTFKK